MYNIKCGACNRKINQNKMHKALTCKSCLHLVHRKCSGLKLSDLNKLSNNRFRHWECRNCYSDKFPFNTITDNEVMKLSFDSNFDCSCTVNTDNDPVQKNILLELAKFKKPDKYGPDPEGNLEKCFGLDIKFDYYSNHSFHKLSATMNNKKCFTIFHTNIESLQCNFDRLKNYLVDLDVTFDIIALSETWNPLEKNKDFKPGKLDGYKKYIGTPGSSLKSGCGLYIRDSITYIERHKLDIAYVDDNEEFQTKWIEIINNKTSNILVCVTYRHPRKQAGKIYNNSLREKLCQVKKENKLLFLVGDTNYDFLKMNTNPLIGEFYELITEHFLQPTILEPTRMVGAQRPTLIDNIFSNALNKHIHSGNLYSRLSDHMPNFCFVSDVTTSKRKIDRVIRDFKSFNVQSYQQDLANIILPVEILNNTDIDPVYNYYHEQIMKVINKHAPYKTLSRREIKLKRQPWITKGIRKAIKKKNVFTRNMLERGINFGISAATTIEK